MCISLPTMDCTVLFRLNPIASLPSLGRPLLLLTGLVAALCDSGGGSEPGMEGKRVNRRGRPRFHHVDIAAWNIHIKTYWVRFDMPI